MHATNDRDNPENDEVVVTREMKKAGAWVLSTFSDAYPQEQLAELLYRKMACAAPSEK